MNNSNTLDSNDNTTISTDTDSNDNTSVPSSKSSRPVKVPLGAIATLGAIEEFILLQIILSNCSLYCNKL